MQSDKKNKPQCVSFTAIFTEQSNLDTSFIIAEENLFINLGFVAFVYIFKGILSYPKFTKINLP